METRIKASDRIMSDSDISINLDYFYEDEEMYETMLRYVIDLPNTHVLPPISNLLGHAESSFNLGQLLQETSNEYKSNNITDYKIMVPYNLGAYHWIALFINIKNGVASQIICCDSLGTNPDILYSLIIELSQYYPDANIAFINLLLQNDHSSCGPLTIENLIILARASDESLQKCIIEKNYLNNETKKLDEFEIFLIRKKHVLILEAYNPKSTFRNKQLTNVSAVKSLTTQLKYHNIKIKFSPQDDEIIADVVTNIESLENNSHKKKIANLLVFNNKKYGDNIKAYFNFIRSGLDELILEATADESEKLFKIRKMLFNSTGKMLLEFNLIDMIGHIVNEPQKKIDWEKAKNQIQENKKQKETELKNDLELAKKIQQSIDDEEFAKKLEAFLADSEKALQLQKLEDEEFAKNKQNEEPRLPSP